MKEMNVKAKRSAHIESYLKEEQDLEYKKRKQEARKWLSRAIHEVDPKKTLAIARLKKRLSQIDLARLMECNLLHVAKIESGDPISRKTAKKLADTLDLSLEEIDILHKNTNPSNSHL